MLWNRQIAAFARAELIVCIVAEDEDVVTEGYLGDWVLD